MWESRVSTKIYILSNLWQVVITVTAYLLGSLAKAE